jgi:hypothetical protein
LPLKRASVGRGALEIGAIGAIFLTGYAFPQTYEDTWCGRYRRSEASIRSGNPGAGEILKHFEKEGRA